MSHVKVTAFWDAEADVWVARSDDVPGLVLEAESLPVLVSELEEMIPEMMRENGQSVDGQVKFELDAQYQGVTPALEA